MKKVLIVVLGMMLLSGCNKYTRVDHRTENGDVRTRTRVDTDGDVSVDIDRRK